jgi:hypothetical protein
VTFVHLQFADVRHSVRFDITGGPRGVPSRGEVKRAEWGQAENAHLQQGEEWRRFVLDRDTEILLRGDRLCIGAEACAKAKAA